MAYWRMQLHPTDPSRAMMHTVQSLASNLIGFGFNHDPGDLMRLSTPPFPPGVTAHDLAFATKMAVGDRVLVMVHHFPFALATVTGEYNYIRAADPGLHEWMRHFRRVQDVRYYADRITDAHKWAEIVMTGTVQPLTEPTSASYQLIAGWE